MSADNFASDRDAWLRQILSDRTLKPLAVQVALDLALRFNSRTRECFPHQDTIADAVGANRNSVAKTLRQLATAGYVHSASPNGKRGGNTYRMLAISSRNGSVYDPRRDDNDGTYNPSGDHKNLANHSPGDSPMIPGGIVQSSLQGSSITSEENLRIEPPASAAVAGLHVQPASAAAPISKEEMLRRLRNAASLRVEDGPGTRDPQPIRDLMNEGADFERHVIPAVIDFVRGLSSPLRTWKAGPLIKAIRDRMVMEPERSHEIRGVMVPESRILAHVRSYIETGIWPEDLRGRWGPAPDEFGTHIPKSLFRWTPPDGPMQEVEFCGNSMPEAGMRMMVFRWRRTRGWHGAWGYPPDDERTSVPLRFRRDIGITAAGETER